MCDTKPIEAKRSAVTQLWLNGHRQAEILKSLGSKNYTRSFISRTISRYNKYGTLKDAPRSGRPRSVRTTAAKRKVKQMIMRKPVISFRQIASRTLISNTSVGRILKYDLGVKSFKRTKTEALTPLTIGKRLQRCHKLVTRLKNVDHENIVFSDEKIWSIEEKYNSQNSRVYSISRENIPEEVKHVATTLHPKSVMVWAGISAKGKTSMVFVPEGAKINAISYQKLILSKHVLPISSTFMKGEDWLFQQDGAPAHTAKINQEWLSNNIPDFFNKDEWPPSSPDLNPCDYYLWGRMEAIVNNHAHKSLQALKRAILRSWNDLDHEEVARACNNFPERLKMCIKARGKRF